MSQTDSSCVSENKRIRDDEMDLDDKKRHCAHIPGIISIPQILGSIGFNGRPAFSINYIEKVEDNGLSLTGKMIMVRNRALERALELLGFPDNVIDRVM